MRIKESIAICWELLEKSKNSTDIDIRIRIMSKSYLENEYKRETR